MSTWLNEMEYELEITQIYLTTFIFKFSTHSTEIFAITSNKKICILYKRESNQC